MSYFWLTLERIPDDLGFSLYDRTHLCWLLGICAGIVLLVWVCRRICEDTCRRLLQGIGWGMLGLEVLKVAVLLSTGQFRAAYLPLDLCGLSVFLEFAAVWKPHPLLLELLYSLSLPGACLALLFPNWFPLPLWNFFSIHSFVIHGLLVAVPVIFLARGTLRPDWKRLPFCFTMVAAACIPIVWVNHRFHTNFFFLSWPTSGSPLIWFGREFGNYRIGLPVLMALIWTGMYGIPALCQLIRRHIAKS
ncbi:YwaF family protein [uncultured Ruminococcus sp.]|uniref:YwaF family protein n=1 Tax=uncultured Ruminococcus sp. TaxID=165186 RepID=UPI002659778F|nr:YwaF family protein [uncultured Ruminococcus sp.]